ncbi:MAG: hypothetical protein K9G58_11180 [Bacteroidales bacterium]|nr:hypothetical protein [Bacteroidales bacterium]MCF8387292.1 hypothetical protein [Bacteroidales bacterium]MCF8398726.1 hypothetical protein [Bacteroidales bacterium]
MKRFVHIGIAVIFVLLITDAAQAIPAFARKYNMSCMTCHNPIPRLKAYGDSFAGNGFQLEDRKAPRYTVETGDNLLSLIRNFPLAVRLDGYASIEHHKNKENETTTDFRTPFLLKLLSGGSLSEHLAYYFYFYMDERGEVAGVEDAYLMYNNLFNIDLDIYLGQFQVSDPLFKRELRLTLEDYHIYTVSPGISNINLKYDKGVMVTLGTNFGTTIVGEVLNGNGIGEANENWQFDNDKYKNLMGRVSQDVSDFLRIGAFTYYGNEAIHFQDLYIDSEKIATYDGKNEAVLWGPDMSIALNDKFEFNLQYLQRTDSRVIDMDPKGEYQLYKDVKTQGGFGEIIFTPKGDKSRWYLVGLYNWTDSDLDDLDFQSASIQAGYLLRRNVRLVSEYSYNFSHENREWWRGSLGFVAAF